jgi:hypothetical protein
LPLISGAWGNRDVGQLIERTDHMKRYTVTADGLVEDPHGPLVKVEEIGAIQTNAIKLLEEASNIEAKAVKPDPAKVRESRRFMAAAMAMQGLLINPDCCKSLTEYAKTSGKPWSDCLSEAATHHADALLAELEKKP